MSWRLSDSDNINNSNRNNDRSGNNKSRSRSPYNLRPLEPVDYKAMHNHGTAADDSPASRSSRRASTSRRRSSARTTGRSRTATDRPSRSRNSNEVTQADVVEEDEMDDEELEYEGSEVADETQDSTRFTEADKSFYPINFNEQEVRKALRNRGTFSPSTCEAVPNAFENVGGLGETIHIIHSTIRFPLVCPEFFTQFRLKPNRGLIFYGPPGVGKTMMARALVDCCSHYTNRKIAFFMRKGSDLLNRYVGQSEANLAKLFDAAKQLSPSIIFLDEVDALAPVRTSNENNHVETNVVSTLLALMDGLEDRGMVFVIGATNRLEAIDPALRRPGRFDLEICFQLPNLQARKDIVSKVTSTWGITTSIIDKVADRTSDFSGADLANLCKTAAFKALERTNPGIATDDDDDTWQQIDIKNIRVKMEDFDAALRIVQPTNQRLQNN